MKNFIKIPDVTVYKGIVVDKKSKLSFEREDGSLRQELKNLTFTQYEKRTADNFESEIKTTIHLKKGMVVLFEDENRGYVVPYERYVPIKEAYENIGYILDLDEK